MNNDKPKLSISISREHQENLVYIKDIFKDFNAEINANLIRCSANELPMAIIIFIGGSIASGLTWDLIKLAIKKTYEKFPKSRITVRDKDSIMYTIGVDLTVNVRIPPGKEKEFEHIKNFDDLGKYINSKNKKK